MSKRLLISVLWFVSMWVVGGAVALLLDVPRAVMIAPAAAIAAGMWIALSRAEERELERAERLVGGGAVTDV